LHDGDPGGGKAPHVLNEKFGQNLANPLWLAATPVLDVGDAVIHGFPPENTLILPNTIRVSTTLGSDSICGKMDKLARVWEPWPPIQYGTAARADCLSTHRAEAASWTRAQHWICSTKCWQKHSRNWVPRMALA
jgi:hypothetical protein